MASLSIDPNGCAAVYVKLPTGARKPVRLGKVARPKAETIRGHLEQLEAATLHNLTPPTETRRWVEGVADTLRMRMAAAGLCDPPVKREAATLGPFADAWLKWKGATVKGSTLTRAAQARRLLVELFGENRPLASITPGDADDWRAWMLGTRTATVKATGKPRPATLAEATVRRRTGDARDLFAYAARKGLREGVNPFAHLPTGDVVNSARRVHVSDADARAVLAELQGRGALTTTDLRTAFGLSRWAGLRMPSEAAGLTWRDVDWAGKRLTVRSPKTEHLPGHDTRTLPLFPELAALLQDALEAAEDGAVYVCPYLRTHTTAALVKPVEQAAERAGVKRWPKLFHQLRASRQTDLTNAYPAHVVCGWLGNTKDVAEAHYLTTTDDHYARATAGAADLSPDTAPGAHRAVRNPVRAGEGWGVVENEKPPSSKLEGGREVPRGTKVARPGLEQEAKTCGGSNIGRRSGAQSGARGTPDVGNRAGPHLTAADVLDALPHLTPAELSAVREALDAADSPPGETTPRRGCPR